MKDILSWKMKVTSWSIENQYLLDLFWTNEIEFWDEKKINNWDNYYSLIIGKNWVWKSSFIKWLVSNFINKKKNKDIELMFTTHSVFDDIIRSDKEKSYIYNWIKWKNNSANSKSIYNLNKIKLFTLLERKNNHKIIDTFKYIYNLDNLEINDIKIKFTFLEWLKELLSHDKEGLGDAWYWINKVYDLIDEIDKREWVWLKDAWYDILDEIKEVFRDDKYRFNVDNISEELLIAIYIFVTISDKIEIENDVDITTSMGINDFFQFKKLFENRIKKYKKMYEKLIEKEFKNKFPSWEKENSIKSEEKDRFYKNIFKYVKKEINFSELKKLESLFKTEEAESNLISSFNSFFTDTYKNIRYIQSVIEYNFYDFLNEISRIRQKNWWYEAFTYDLGYTDKKSNTIKYFWNSSSGELVLLYTYLHLTDFNKKKGIKKVLIIDEPEISLHPQWQRDYINKIDSLFSELKLKNVFTIIVTHSPLIVLWWQDLKVKNWSEFENKYNVDTYAFYKDNEKSKTKSTKLDYISKNSIDEVLWDDFWVEIFHNDYLEGINERYETLKNNLLKNENNKKKL